MYLLIGQGLAGSLLADALLQRGQRVRVVADARPTASGVAAGLFNPVTGRKPQLTWRADALFPFLHRFYPDLETRLGARFFHPLPLYRPFGSASERADGLKLTAEPALRRFLEPAPDDGDYAATVRNDFGGLRTLGAGWVDVPALLTAFRRFLTERGLFEEATFSPESLHLTTDGAVWMGQNFTRVVFCEGAYATENPFFNWLPFNPVKGESLTLRLDGPLPPGISIPGIVNRGVWLIPRADATARVGATYVWKPLDWENTDEGRAFLEEKLRVWLKPSYAVIGQAAGIRPAVQGRRPLLGLHPEFRQLALFNGLGSKGVSLAPFFAQQMAELLVYGKEPDETVNINRFFSLYSGRKRV
jgi:glycine/D-amino acid oxidase-like deaminating enzyme